MVGLVSRIFQRRQDVFPFQKRVVDHDFLEGSARCQKLKYVADTNPVPADTRPPAALPLFNGDSAESVEVHSPQV